MDSVVNDMDDKPREACAVFGIYAPGHDVAASTYFGLFALQHRGQESSGIACANGFTVECYKEMGLVSQVYTPEILQRLVGHIAIGHNRYSTTGSSNVLNAQPILIKTHLGPMALAHNGNLTNYQELTKEVQARKLPLVSSSDSELVARLLAVAPGEALADKIRWTMNMCRGSYSIVLCTKDALVGFRDPLGVRPLCIGEMELGTYVLASETCALHTVGARWMRDVKPGEIVVIDESGLHSHPSPAPPREAFCLFEYIYFARPDSLMEGHSIYRARVEMGRVLAHEYPVEADAVLGVPDSAIPSAIGYAEAAGIPYKEGLIKNRYIARTFIQPDDAMRKQGIKMKFNPLVENIAGQRVVVVDDSIVRGNTTRAIVKLLKEAGAKEVHVRITSPPMIHPCFYGVDTATYAELIASQRTVKEIEQHVDADSLGYLSLEGLIQATRHGPSRLCQACFTGRYPGTEAGEPAQKPPLTAAQ
ncbi:MAG TPA: amidophosphoribosyltransferase [Candidatus Xenobia bacterium]|jgi:amidophosphoribosyltransferase